MPDKRNTVRRLKTTAHRKDMTNTVKNTDIPGPTSLEAYELVHGDKEDTTSKEARMDQLYQDFRARIDTIKPLVLLGKRQLTDVVFKPKEPIYDRDTITGHESRK